MENRHCAECTACCQGWLFSEKLKMRPGSPCVHCTVQGCEIYDDRPENPCRKFKCAWLAEGETLPADMRPDKCGAIIMLDRKWNGWNIIKAVPVGTTIPEETLEWLKAYAREHKIPLLFQENLKTGDSYTGFKNLGYGPPAFLQRVNEVVGPDDIMKI